ncbi:amidohydrolase family protein [Microvirga lotononidis]|uniref:Putative TIM-barrel fold metal-dependent hydrolase n=1 Tax=Microvirga lotononidis TaxID=864069 RepID=I4YSJ2_9HYPH|nr:amidohydrolase family protein [Microvirga lotononidis]EIM26934.1 putative TIM-barrel fold metal-dependent hydrolase [Microvirga lotononidis]WQO31478.1 amidohydrolase family protein [Microvirga lotononidis]
MSDTRAEIPIIDAHQHFWNLSTNYYPWLQDPDPIPFRYGDYSALKRNYLPADLRRDIGSYRVVKTIHIEAEWDRSRPVAETEWLHDLSRREGLPTVCVAHAALDAPDADETLYRQSRVSIVRGIRHKPTAAGSPGEAKRGAPGSMDDPQWRKGYAILGCLGLSFDLQTPWWHLDAASELARDFPNTQIIINHTGLPADRSPEGLAAWRSALEKVATCPNIAIKISGLGQKGRPWSLESNAPVIRDAIAIFGADRAMFASNYPVDSLVASYGTIVAGFLAAIADRPMAEQYQLTHDSAERIYRL